MDRICGLIGRGIFMNKKIYHVYLLDIDSHADTLRFILEGCFYSKEEAIKCMEKSYEYYLQYYLNSGYNLEEIEQEQYYFTVGEDTCEWIIAEFDLNHGQEIDKVIFSVAY